MGLAQAAWSTVPPAQPCAPGAACLTLGNLSVLLLSVNLEQLFEAFLSDKIWISFLGGAE